MFLEWNGYEVKDPGMRLYEAMIAIAERRLEKKGLAALIKELAKPTKSVLKKKASEPQRTKAESRSRHSLRAKPRRSGTSPARACRFAPSSLRG